MRLSFALVTVAFVLAPCRASAQGRDDRSPRLAANLTLGVGGELDLHVEGSSSRGDLNLYPSVGFDVRFESPLADVVAIGGWFELLTTQTDLSASEREESVAFDVFVRLRWSVEVVARELWLEPYALLAAGLTLALDPSFGDDEVWPGWNTACAAGAQLLHGSGIFGFLEVGWRHYEVYGRIPFVGFAGGWDASLVLNELLLNVGVGYAVGASG